MGNRPDKPLETGFSNWLGKRRPILSRALVAGAMLVPALIVVAAATISEWRLQRFLLFYLVPPVIAVLLWARLRLLDQTDWTRRKLLMDTIVVVLAASRFISGFLPISGHMLFFTYSGLTTRNRWYQVLALVFWLETTFLKLWVWNDVLTWALGIVVGCVAAVICEPKFGMGEPLLNVEHRISSSEH